MILQNKPSATDSLIHSVICYSACTRTHTHARTHARTNTHTRIQITYSNKQTSVFISTKDLHLQNIQSIFKPYALFCKKKQFFLHIVGFETVLREHIFCTVAEVMPEQLLVVFFLCFHSLLHWLQLSRSGWVGWAGLFLFFFSPPFLMLLSPCCVTCVLFAFISF